MNTSTTELPEIYHSYLYPLNFEGLLLVFVKDYTNLKTLELTASTSEYREGIRLLREQRTTIVARELAMSPLDLNQIVEAIIHIIDTIHVKDE